MRKRAIIDTSHTLNLLTTESKISLTFLPIYQGKAISLKLIRKLSLQKFETLIRN